MPTVGRQSCLSPSLRGDEAMSKSTRSSVTSTHASTWPMPWPMRCVSAVRVALPRRRRSSIATGSCTMRDASSVLSASNSSPKVSSMSLRSLRNCVVPDFLLLFLLLPGEFIIGRVIKAMNNSWHPDCFCCDLCQAVLADVGFVKNAGRHLCRPCHNREKARGLGKYICQKCHAIIEEQPLLFKNDPYHPDHFNCNNCGKELTADARELKGELYCLPCHDKMGVPICGACRRPIEGRVVNAMGKQWHVEHHVCALCERPFHGHPYYERGDHAYCEKHFNMHFVCAKCEKPFLGHRHYERKGLAYCETHYNQLFGDVCYHCNRVIEGDVVSALNKAWCVNCFACSTCNTKLTLKDKFVEVDLKPVCKHCYERLPDDMKRRLAKQEKEKKKRMPMCLNKFVEFDMKPVCKKCYEKFPLELKKRLKKLAETVGRK
ncbi:unnamed protein product [Oncorhynchus mykiss]|uniref:LIM zinc-binding domain-containing protein n=1 Tax=Oncorhynchus mykiss TaxID=8022 RepID=A0A060XRV0_ONCMY|nr:unnamed protein product [Oncorhynchus mykiss]